MATALALPHEQSWAEQNAQETQAARQSRVSDDGLPISEQGAHGEAAQIAEQARASGMSKRQLQREATRLQKRSKIRMEFLTRDLDAEEKGMKTDFFDMTGMALYGISDIIDVANLGTVWTIVNWFIYIITGVIIIKRIWNYATIRYADPKRQIRRAEKLVQRAVWRVIMRLLIAIGDAVPILSIGPWFSGGHNLEVWMKRRHTVKIKRLRAQKDRTEKWLRRLQVRARTPQQKFSIAQLSTRAVDALEKKFDAI